MYGTRVINALGGAAGPVAEGRPAEPPGVAPPPRETPGVPWGALHDANDRTGFADLWKGSWMLTKAATACTGAEYWAWSRK